MIDCNTTGLLVNDSCLGEIGSGRPDTSAMAIAIAINPVICTRSSKHPGIPECEATFAHGMTVVDLLNATIHDTANFCRWQRLPVVGLPDITVGWGFDVSGGKAMLKTCVRRQI